jgi:hypothetical protein
LTPPGSSMGSAKRLSQDTTQLRHRTEIQSRATGFVPAAGCRTRPHRVIDPSPALSKGGPLGYCW